ncbi:MAG TPA: ABC transporter ATP-binding protein [Thermodesulfobacteriota bacterium]|jgi:peptide/nickel transport system ATP-binding protein/oligopeptide transport system ATP-binding protein|nr:ABC transporter ATP-binding protein [Thermodesulfobacteriota bacterium]
MKQKLQKNVLLEVQNLSIHFFTDEGVIRAVENVTFEIYSGEILGLVGESGCGKSVTGLSLLRLIPIPPGRIVNGQIVFDGRSLLQLEEKEMEKVRGNDISMIFQEPMTSLNPVFTIGDQIMEAIILHQGLNKTEARQRAIEMLDRVKIPSPEKRIDSYPHQLSGGMRQRAMIAMALSCQPKLLVADEPTTALDVTIQAEVLRLLKEIQGDMGMSVMLITHDLGVVAEIADRVAVMYAGRIFEYGPIEAIFGKMRNPYTRGLMRSIPQLAEKKDRLNAIPGQVPDPMDLPVGCKFHPRCYLMIEECKKEEPPLFQVNGNHFSRCIRWKECC